LLAVVKEGGHVSRHGASVRVFGGVLGVQGGFFENLSGVELTVQRARDHRRGLVEIPMTTT
jgi:hypothetical protein